FADQSHDGLAIFRCEPVCGDDEIDALLWRDAVFVPQLSSRADNLIKLVHFGGKFSGRASDSNRLRPVGELDRTGAVAHAGPKFLRDEWCERMQQSKDDGENFIKHRYVRRDFARLNVPIAEV